MVTSRNLALEQYHNQEIDSDIIIQISVIFICTCVCVYLALCNFIICIDIEGEQILPR